MTKDEALKRIADWNEHPASLAVELGSNGVRDYYRQIAKAALAEQDSLAVGDLQAAFVLGQVTEKRYGHSTSTVVPLQPAPAVQPLTVPQAETETQCKHCGADLLPIGRDKVAPIALNLRNVVAVERTSDQRVTFVFSSAAAASEFEGKAAPQASAVQPLTDDPLQGAVDWFLQAHGESFCTATVQRTLMIGYIRAKRLCDVAKQKAAHGIGAPKE